MAQQNINLGTPPGGTDGDTVRSAMGKIQANTTELYTNIATNTSALSVTYGLKNKFINGNCDIWTRGTSIAAYQAAVKYLCDRFYSTAGGSTIAVSQQAFTSGQTAVPNGPTFFQRYTVASVAGPGNYAIFGQRIEGVEQFSGKTLTLSFWAKADAARSIGIEIAQVFGSSGSATIQAVQTTSRQLTANWAQYTYTFVVPSTAGKTIAGGNDCLDVIFWLDCGSNYTSRGTIGQQSGTFDFAELGVGEGPYTSNFGKRPVALEAPLCQRYCRAGSHAYTGMSGVSTQYAVCPFGVPMRATPTITVSGYVDNDSAGTGSVTAVNASANGINTVTNAGSATKVGRYFFNFIADAEL